MEENWKVSLHDHPNRQNKKTVIKYAFQLQLFNIILRYLYMDRPEERLFCDHFPFKQKEVKEEDH